MFGSPAKAFVSEALVVSSPACKIHPGRNQITGSENRSGDSAADFVFGNKQTQLSTLTKKKTETPADNKAMFLREGSRFFQSSKRFIKLSQKGARGEG